MCGMYILDNCRHIYVKFKNRDRIQEHAIHLHSGEQERKTAMSLKYLTIDFNRIIQKTSDYRMICSFTLKK